MKPKILPTARLAPLLGAAKTQSILIRLTFSLGIAVAFTLTATGKPEAAFAQSAYDSQPDPYPTRERDTFSGSFGDDAINPFDLLHRMNLSRERSLEEFTEDQQRSLNEASADFRRRQQELLRQQPASPAPEASTPDGM